MPDSWSLRVPYLVKPEILEVYFQRECRDGFSWLGILSTVEVFNPAITIGLGLTQLGFQVGWESELPSMDHTMVPGVFPAWTTNPAAGS